MEHTLEVFDKHLNNFYVDLEELRQFTLRDNDPSELLERLSRATSHYETLLVSAYEEVQGLIVQDCYRKLQGLVPLVLNKVFIKVDGRSLPDGAEVQSVIASLMELCLTIIHMNQQQQAEIIEEMTDSRDMIHLYQTFQREILKQRVETPIAQLVSHRKTLHLQVAADHEEDDEQEQPPHIKAVISTLSEATTLIHPLRSWFTGIYVQEQQRDPVAMDILYLCKSTSHQLHLQVEEILKENILAWFKEDKELSAWVKLCQDASYSNGSSGNNDNIDLLDLDHVLEEVAFMCQVQCRYCEFIQDTFGEMSQSRKETEKFDKKKFTSESFLWLYLQEISGQYATLEDFLSSSSLKRAIDVTAPVEIMDSVFVPSIVEDAYFISRRAVERTSSTLNDQALMVTASRIGEAWGLEGDIFKALRVGKGCDYMQSEKLDPSKGEDNKNSANISNIKGPKKDYFATALLDAIDDDIHTDTSNGHSGQNSAISALEAADSGVSLKDRRLFSLVCNMNGIASAISASLALGNLFNGVIESKGTDAPNLKILKFTHEELCNHSKAFENLLKSKVYEAVEKWVGSIEEKKWLDYESRNMCIPSLHKFFEDQDYNISSSTFTEVDKRDLLKQRIITLFEQNSLVKSITEGKCENKVSLELVKSLAGNIAESLERCILASRKQFNDWGSLLLSKQIRACQDFLACLLRANEAINDNRSSTSSILASSFQRIGDILTVLQLERPNDWISQRYCTHTSLSNDEVGTVMSLRVEFSQEAIKATLNRMSKQ